MTNTIFTSFAGVPPTPHVVSIGTFDGVHLGHRHLLRSALSRSTKLGLPLLVVTFEPIPAQVIRPALFQGRLTTPQRKLEILHSLGELDLLVLPFTENLMRQSPEAFMEALNHAARPVELWVGEEFALGHQRAGTLERLAEIGSTLGFSVHPVHRLDLGGDVISSSRIRQQILAGEPGKAALLLGDLFAIAGEVIRGAQIGRTIGFPTANVVPPSDLVALPDGIYASYAMRQGQTDRLPAMTYIGTRPALNTGARLIETHILDFSGDLYDEILHTDFVCRLRPDANFESVEELIAQLNLDELDTRRVLSDAK